MRIVTVIIKLCIVGVAIAAGGFWAGAGVDRRPKYRDEQTLIGSTIWSQSILTVGLIISEIVEETTSMSVIFYFEVAGTVLFLLTGIILVIYETKAWKLERAAVRGAPRGEPQGEPREVTWQVPSQASADASRHRKRAYDKIYFSIGILCLVGALLTVLDIVILVLIIYKVI